jgi:hypothetical protein
VSKRSPAGGFAIALVVIVLLTMAPVLSVLLSFGVAAAAGCSVNEASTTPCEMFGADIGALLATLFTSGWFILLTLPLGLCAFAAWLVAFLVWRNRVTERI